MMIIERVRTDIADVIDSSVTVAVMGPCTMYSTETSDASNTLRDYCADLISDEISTNFKDAYDGGQTLKLLVYNDIDAIYIAITSEGNDLFNHIISPKISE